MHFQWEYAWLSVWHVIYQQRCETERWFQRTNYRKLHIRSPMVTWPITSRDPERSRSWPQYLRSLISQKPCETNGWFKLTTHRIPYITKPMVTWPMMSLVATRRRSWECISPPSKFLKTPRFGKICGCHVRTVPGNMYVKFEVRSFNRFGAIGI